MAIDQQPKKRGNGGDAATPSSSDGLDPELEALQRRYTRLLRVVARRWTHYGSDVEFRNSGTSFRSLLPLLHIAGTPAGSTQNEIARRLQVRGPTLVRALHRLEKAGFVERVPSPIDKRSNLIKLTPSGKKMVTHIRAYAAKLRADFLLGIEPEDLQAGIRVFEILVAWLDARDPASRGFHSDFAGD
jgi:MarR family transcriptional regulator for hemolysin